MFSRSPQAKPRARTGRVDLGQFRFRGDMIDELKLIHYGLSVRMRRSVVGAGSEVRRLQRLYDTATRATARSYSSLPLEGAHRRPKRIDSRVRSIARRFAQGTQAFAGTAGEKRALLPPKTAPQQKKAANSEEFAAILGASARRRHPILSGGGEGRQCATSPWPSSSDGPRGGCAVATSSSHTIGVGWRRRA